MNYTLAEIAQILGTTAKGANSSTPINDVIFDSRRISSPASSIFFALPGEKRNGEEFIMDCYRKGIRFFVCESWTFTHECPEASYIEVKNAISALQLLATFHRKQFDIPVIGITGSNGKTIVKEWLAQLTSSFFKTIRSPKSYNSQIGVPLSLLNIRKDHELAIIEAGISKPGEMSHLQKMIAPSIGVLTNIGESHLEFFLGKEELSNEKIQLFSNCEVIVGKKSEYLSEEIIHRFNPTAKSILWSNEKGSSVFLKKIQRTSSSSLIEIEYSNLNFQIEIPFTDDASVENAVHVFCICIALDIHERVGRLFKNLQPVNMRMQIVTGMNDSFLVDDSYSSDFFSLKIALDFLDRHRAHRKTTVVLSDILQSPYSQEELYKKVASLLKEKSIDRLIAIGDQIKEYKNLFPQNSTFYSNTKDFLSNTKPNDHSGEAILVKGAREFGFEKIVIALQEQSHETVMEIDLGALAHNLRYFRSKLQPQVKTMVMVKAAGYGTGAIEISKVLEYHRVDYLAVAYSDEGVSLRNGGITTPIMVMNPDQSGLDAMLHYRLEPEVYSIRSLQNLLEAMNRTKNYSVPAHIKLDTGMHRLGFESHELPVLIEFLSNHSEIQIGSIFTHLVASEDPSNDTFTAHQISLFKEMSQQIIHAIGYRPMLHASNTGGIERHPDAQFDMIRLGIGLYGVSPSFSEQQMLKPVSSLKTRISQIKHIPVGDSVGYNRKFIAKRPTTVATIPIGYADGLKRSLSNGVGRVKIGSHYCPIIGNVCMDMTMIDVTEAPAEVGDTVVIFGDSPSINEIASNAETIPYEILTSISQRVKRVYIEE